ncbi:patatin-like phospholipase family protein [Pseudomonadota bacterium]
MKTVSLVLGSGGARGLAHIGVIHWLREHDYKIESISGCSIGALVGGIYAAGKLDEFEHWVRAIKKIDIVTLLDISFSKSGLVKGDKIINSLVELVGNQPIENLPIRYTAVAADLVNEKEVWINTGSLFDAIRASISLPLFFTPHLRNGIKLVDGGVLIPVPIAPTFIDNTQMVIAVNLGGTVESNHTTIEDQTIPAEESPILHEKIKGYITRLQQNMNEISGVDWSVYDIANQSFDAMQSTIARQKLAAYPPDYTIEIARNACGTLEFDRAGEMIALGYRMAQENLS